MRNFWINRFEAIEKKMKENPNVIIDDTPDNRAAAALSDGLISDISSWTRQYLYTGKPVLYIYGSRSTLFNQFITFDDGLAYFIKDGISIDSFIQDIIIEQKDSEREYRLQRLCSMLENTDGTCGQKVHYLIKGALK